MRTYTYETEEGVVEAFWDAGYFNFDTEEATRNKRKSKDYRTDVRVAFVEFVDGLQKDGHISEELAFHVTL